MSLITIIEWLLLAALIYNTFENIKEAGNFRKFIPNEKIEIATDLPFEGITPGQLAFLRSNEFMKLGDVFAGSLLSLSYKNAIKFVYKGNEYNFKNTFIAIETENVPNLVAEEVPIYAFLKESIEKFGRTEKNISLYMLQKLLSNSSERVVTLKKTMDSSIKNSLTCYNSESLSKIKMSLMKMTTYFLIIVALIYIHKTGSIDIFSLRSWVEILSIINIIHEAKTIIKTNVFNQQGTDYQEKVRGLENYLKNFDANQLPDVAIWNYYMPYVLALGIQATVVPKIEKRYNAIINSEFEEMYRNSKNVINCQFDQIFASVYVI